MLSVSLFIASSRCVYVEPENDVCLQHVNGIKAIATFNVNDERFNLQSLTWFYLVIINSARTNRWVSKMRFVWNIIQETLNLLIALDFVRIEPRRWIYFWCLIYAPCVQNSFRKE